MLMYINNLYNRISYALVMLMAVCLLAIYHNYSAKWWRGKLWPINRFRVLARKMLVNLNFNDVVLEFGFVKYW